MRFAFLFVSDRSIFARNKYNNDNNKALIIAVMIFNDRDHGPQLVAAMIALVRQ